MIDLKQILENRDIANKMIADIGTLTVSKETGLIEINDNLSDFFKRNNINDEKIEPEFILLLTADGVIYYVPLVDDDYIDFNKMYILSEEIILEYDEFVVYKDKDGDYVYYSYNGENDFDVLKEVQKYTYEAYTDEKEADKVIESVASKIDFDVSGEPNYSPDEDKNATYLWFKFKTVEDEKLQPAFTIVEN